MEEISYIKKIKPELLSPAGDKESFFAAIKAGADAIYMGLDEYNARDMIKNFTKKEYIECIKYAHVLGVKVYLTLNVIIFDNEIEEVINILNDLFKNGLDAVIIQDLGLAYIIKKYIKEAVIHASTQMSIYSLEQVKFLEKVGFKRVVLSRELTISEIEYIRKNTNIELEVFVHGALCVSYSGQCLLSYMIGKRSANRGKCAGTCRMKYSLYNADGKPVILNKYLLSKKDIYGLEHLEKLSKIGIDSFKIEGRVKTYEYVYDVTKRYSQKLNEILEMNKNSKNNISKKNININKTNNDKIKKELMQLFNRDGISTGYLDKVQYKNSISTNSPKNTGLILGKILDAKKDYIKLKLLEDISLHDGVEVISDNEINSNIVTCIRDEKFKIVNKETKKGNVVWLGDFKGNIKKDSIVYKTSSSNQIQNINEEIKNVENINKAKIDVKVRVEENKEVTLNIQFKNKNKYIENILNKNNLKYININTEKIAETAIKNVITKSYIIENFKKAKNELFEIEEVSVDIVGQAFLSVSNINKIRNKMFEFLKDVFLKEETTIEKIKIENRKTEKEVENKEKGKTKKSILHILDMACFEKIDNFKKYNYIYINVYDYIKNKERILKKINISRIYLVIPNVVLNNLNRILKKNIEKYIEEGIAGIVVGNVGYIDISCRLKEKYNIKLIADYSLNISNICTAMIYKKLGFDVATLSIELNEEQITSISNIIEVELVEGYINALTSRYCVLGSFISNANNYGECKFECQKNKYILRDTHGLEYKIICDNFDCIMRLYRLKKEEKLDNTILNNYNIRKVII